MKIKYFKFWINRLYILFIQNLKYLSKILPKTKKEVFAGLSKMNIGEFLLRNKKDFKELKFNYIWMIILPGKNGAFNEILTIVKRSRSNNLLKTLKKNLISNKMTRIKKSNFIDEIKNKYNDSIDVGVEFEDGYYYTIVGRTPDDLVEKMLQEKTNFI